MCMCVLHICYIYVFETCMSMCIMNDFKHPFPIQWMSAGMTRANQYEQAELGKTEVSLIDFAVSSDCCTSKGQGSSPDVCVCVCSYVLPVQKSSVETQ